MKCPHCKCPRSKVIYTQNVFGTGKLRRRMCLRCKKTFPTHEVIIQEKDSMDSFNDLQSKINFPKTKKKI